MSALLSRSDTSSKRAISRGILSSGVWYLDRPTAGQHLHRDHSEEFMSLGRNQQVIIANDYCYEVISGCVRSVRHLEDGRRQISGFFLPADTFGWECSEHQLFGFEAVIPIKLRRIPIAIIEQRVDQEHCFARRLRKFFAMQICRAHDHSLLLGRMTAVERVASFLLDIYRRSSSRGDVSFNLPMTRTDIADCLGLTIETVSRSISQLCRGGFIKVEKTSVYILDECALRAMSLQD